MERVVAYIDGFNLYNGLSDRGWRHYLWLDLRKLADSLMVDGQQLVAVKYFTARVGKPPASVKRQSTFIDALEAQGGLEIIYGKCNYNSESCKGCGREWTRREEKKTDVAIAAHMMRDAFRDAVDTALVLSGDTDLIPAIQIIQAECPGKRVVVACPPKRVTAELNKAADDWFKIDEKNFADSQLPAMLSGADGYPLVQPTDWTY